jgi:hypothetical protein
MDDATTMMIAFAKFAGHLLAKVEAMEHLLIQKDIATKQEIRDAVGAAWKRLDPSLRWLDDPVGGQNFERALAETLERLRVHGLGLS